jgi:hypothetical protein
MHSPNVSFRENEHFARAAVWRTHVCPRNPSVFERKDARETVGDSRDDATGSRKRTRGTNCYVMSFESLRLLYVYPFSEHPLRVLARGISHAYGH